MAMKILIPCNFTPNDKTAVDFAGDQYGTDTEADVTLFHAYTPLPEIDTHNNPIMEKMHRETLYLRQQLTEEKEILEETRKSLMQKGFKSDRVHVLFTPVKKDVADDIIGLVKKQGFDVVVLNRNPGNIINYFTRSISKRLTARLDRRTRIHIVN